MYLSFGIFFRFFDSFIRFCHWIDSGGLRICGMSGGLERGGSTAFRATLGAPLPAAPSERRICQWVPESKKIARESSSDERDRKFPPLVMMKHLIVTRYLPPHPWSRVWHEAEIFDPSPFRNVNKWRWYRRFVYNIVTDLSLLLRDLRVNLGFKDINETYTSVGWYSFVAKIYAHKTKIYDDCFCLVGH